MGVDVGRPLAKALDAARRLQAWLPGSSASANLEKNSDATERLLRDLPADAYKGGSFDPSKKAACRQLMERFQSLGADCEFGFVQRMLGADPLDLFRFAAVSAAGLSDALQSGLVELTNPENLSVVFDGEVVNGMPQTAVVDRAYGFRLHGGHLPPATSFDEVKSLQLKRVKFLRRKFFEDLEDAERIFVYTGLAAVEGDIPRLLSALRQFGPATLLWVTLEERGKPAGTAEHIADGLMRGYLDRFGLVNGKWEPSAPVWLKICCEAYRVHLKQKSRMLP